MADNPILSMSVSRGIQRMDIGARLRFADLKTARRRAFGGHVVCAPQCSRRGG